MSLQNELLNYARFLRENGFLYTESAGADILSESAVSAVEEFGTESEPAEVAETDSAGLRERGPSYGAAADLAQPEMMAMETQGKALAGEELLYNNTLRSPILQPC